MPGRILFLAALLAVPAFAQTSDPVPEAPPASVPETAAAANADTPAPDAASASTDSVAPEAPPAAADIATPEISPLLPAPAPEMTPTQRLEQFRHDQINLLALHGDPGSLLAAALMASADAGDKARPNALQSPALLKRAQNNGPESALVWWVTAAFDCHATPNDCPHAETLRKLEGIEADNAAVWTLSLWHAQKVKDAAGARAALASAAQAKNYNDHFGALIDTVYGALGVLPIGPEILNATGQNVSADGYRLISAAGTAAGMALPGYFAIGDACKGADAGDAALLADCLAVARKMELSGSINSQNAGLTLKMALEPAGPEQDATRARQRVLSWQILRISDLGDRLAADPALSHVYTQAIDESGDESAGVLAVLRSQGVALEPPPGWQSPKVKSTPTP